MPNSLESFRLKESPFGDYIYNPPQTPPFEKEGLVVSLRLTSPGGENVVLLLSSVSHLRFVR
jgi:hypothetical protein